MSFPKLRELLEAKGGETAWVIVYTADKLILGKRAPGTRNPNLWNFFGGHVDPGESTVDAAVRELEEEIGLKVSPSNLKQISTIGDATYFSCKVKSLSGMRKTSEVSKISTFKLIDLPDNLHSKTQNFFDQLENLLA